MIFGTNYPTSLNATKIPSSFPCESPLTETANDASILDAPDIEGPSKGTGGNVVTRLVECHGIHRLDHGKDEEICTGKAIHQSHLPLSKRFIPASCVGIFPRFVFLFLFPYFLPFPHIHSLSVPLDVWSA
jgi:hypothetical protein